MKPGARIQAAIEVMQHIEDHHQPALQALSHWGVTHRFAGSTDRAIIGNLVFDTLRHRAAVAWKMRDDTALKCFTSACRWLAVVYGLYGQPQHRNLSRSDEICTYYSGVLAGKPYP